MTNQVDKTGLLLVISGPSGVGKTTITHRVKDELGGVFSVSMTTRPKTAKDVEGVDYCFVDRHQFEQAQKDGRLLEWAQVFGHYYGTPAKPVNQAMAGGQLVLLEIDVAGAIQVKQQVPDAFGLFVLPPSEPVLLERLEHRRRDSQTVIQERFAKAKEEIARAKKCGVYDVFIVNDDLDAAVNEAVGIVKQELARRRAVAH